MLIRLLLCISITGYSLGGSSQVTNGDSLALVDLYQATNGTGWLVNTNWLSGMPVGTWHGVTLDNGRVYSISLYGNNLTGTLPESIGDLQLLRWLDLANNQIGDTLPASIANLTNLESLDIHVNEFTGTFPSSMEGMNKLKQLSAYRNNFSGEFPVTVLALTGLERLAIGGNMFHGPVPSELNTMVNLQTLDLASNLFSDTLPYLGDLQKVTEMHLRYNQLEGNPTQIFRYMPNLYYLTISGNKLTGSLEDSLFNPQKIVYLDAQENNLTGLGDFSQHVTEGVIERLRISNNILPFEFLESNRYADEFAYAPQQPLLMSDTLVLTEGDSVRIEAGSGGDYTQYRWYKDNELLPGEHNPSLFIQHFSASDNGVYHAEMTNDSLPLLTLIRNPITLQVLTTAVQNQKTKPLQLYPNPFSDAIYLGDSTSDGELEFYSSDGSLITRLKHSGTSGRIKVDFLKPGNYILRFIAGHDIYTGMFQKL